jgi:DNA topoisomerase-1
VANNLVIVESPAKAKTINKYLGSDYEVIASFGHVRDLPPKDGSVLPDEDFAMKWQPGDRSDKHIKDIIRLAKASKAIYLATDPDREGEAISWHIKEILEDSKLLKDRQLHRVTFNEITKKAVQDAFAIPRHLDMPLIEAYLARRALDYLVGFNLSPVLWRKLPGSRSAGRVQSVALRLVCEREFEIEAFNAQEYWSIEARLKNPDGMPFTARLNVLAGNKLGKLDITNETDALHAVERIKNKALAIHKIEKKQVRRNPAAPFITSTMQQEASRKLGFSASKTMRTAQRLYEGVTIDGEAVGLITYMRTDGTTLSADAVAQCRSVIGSKYGKNYVPDTPRLFKSKAKNAQEAHEAIRPTNLSLLPEKIAKMLDSDQARLYDLIWKRTMASQMEQAILDQVGADISDGTDDVVLRATGSVIAFDGFLTLYQEGRDDEDEGEQSGILPPLNQGDKCRTDTVTPNQHFTQPPPRYSEATLVKKMEELGIGRPSTYASVLQVLRDRNYVILDKRRFVPEDRGRIVTAFLMKFFGKYVDYDFTANLEEELDLIAAGNMEWKDALKRFWVDFSKAVEETKGLTITEVIDHLNETLGAHFFPAKEDGSDPRVCPACSKGQLSLKLGKFGAFVGCSDYPECKFTRQLIVQGDEAESDEAAKLANQPKILGEHPETGRTVSLRRGPYGPYVQIDPPPETKDAPPAEKDAKKDDKEEAKGGKKTKAKGKKKAPAKEKPKRQGLPRGTNAEDVDLAAALKLLALPRDVGTHPETGKIIQGGIGRFGPFLKHDNKFTSLPKDDDVLQVGINRAVVVIAEAAEKKAAKEAAKAEKEAEQAKAPAKKTAKKKPAKKKAVKKKTATK